MSDAAQGPLVVDGTHFVIEFTEPKTAERSWARNMSIDVICETAERALELLRFESPTGVVHVCRRVGSGRPVLIDDVLLVRLVDQPPG